MIYDLNYFEALDFFNIKRIKYDVNFEKCLVLEVDRAKEKTFIRFHYQELDRLKYLFCDPTGEINYKSAIDFLNRHKRLQKLVKRPPDDKDRSHR